jgi:Transcriptional regulator
MTDATMPATRRREATRQKLLDAAAQVFAEVGLDAASVEAICDRAGFTRGAFYSNFETKDELMLALTERIAGEKIDGVTARIQELRDTGEALTPAEIVQRVLDVAVDERMGILLTGEIRMRALRDPALAAAYLAWQSGIVDRVAAVIDELAGTTGSRRGFRIGSSPSSSSSSGRTPRRTRSWRGSSSPSCAPSSTTAPRDSRPPSSTRPDLPARRALALSVPHARPDTVWYPTTEENPKVVARGVRLR